MGPFFYSKKEIPANPEHLVKFILLRLSLLIPPKAM